MLLKDYDISQPYTATVKETTRITPENSDAEVRHIVLEVPDRTFHYVEGQSIGVLAPGPHEFGATEHLRLYSIASSPAEARGEDGEGSTLSICVRRCFYIDEVNGEQYPGKCSNYLCDLRPGDEVSITGPYGRAFVVPKDPASNLLMIGTGTGIAPFRAFLKYIYRERGKWQGKVRLFYGARSGVDLLYMNDVKQDFSLYYDEETFKAIEALSPRPHFDAPIALDKALEAHATEVWGLLQDPKTYVFVAGLEKSAEKLNEALAKMAGSVAAWAGKKAQLIETGRWAELLY